jgi:hypothetical protein
MQTSGTMRREKAKLHQAVIAKRLVRRSFSEGGSNPSIPTPRYGLLRFARNDEERAGVPLGQATCPP